MNGDDPHEQDEKCRPLLWSKALPEHQDREERREDQLALVEHLREEKRREPSGIAWQKGRHTKRRHTNRRHQKKGAAKRAPQEAPQKGATKRRHIKAPHKGAAKGAAAKGATKVLCSIAAVRLGVWAG